MNKHIGFRCPDDLAEMFEKRKAATGRDTTTLMIEALNFYLLNSVEQVKHSDAIALNTEAIQEIVDTRTAYLAEGMNEIKNQLESDIEFLKAELEKLNQEFEARLYPPVTTELSKLGEEDLTKNAIAPEQPKQELVKSDRLSSGRVKKNYPPCPDCGSESRKDGFTDDKKHQRYECKSPTCKRSFVILNEPDAIALEASKKTLTAKQQKDKADSIQRELKKEGLELESAIIKNKILELYPKR